MRTLNSSSTVLLSPLVIASLLLGACETEIDQVDPGDAGPDATDGDVEVACERVIVLARGRVVFDGPPAELASAAREKVWTLHLAPGTEPELAPGALVVDQVPEAAGSVRSRVLHAARPHDRAEPTAPTLEDGYLWLVREPAR